MFGLTLTSLQIARIEEPSPSVVKVSFKDGATVKAKRIHVDPFIDLAVISIPTEAIPANAIEAPLACDRLPSAGTSVFAYPKRLFPVFGIYCFIAFLSFFT